MGISITITEALKNLLSKRPKHCHKKKAAFAAFYIASQLVGNLPGHKSIVSRRN